VRRITSRQNSVVARYRAAAARDTDGIVLLDGAHLVQEALAAGVRLRHLIASVEAMEDAAVARLASQAEASGCDVAVATAPVMAAVSPVRSSSPVVALADRPSDGIRMYSAHAPLIVVVSQVQDPGNVGAIARVAEAAGASGMLVTEGSADPFGWKALRGSMGSSLRIPIAVHGRTEDAVEEARKHGCRIAALVPRGGRAPYDANLKQATALIVGGEGQGLAASLLKSADEQLTIPMHAPVESLNAAVSAALVLYEARRQRN